MRQLLREVLAGRWLPTPAAPCKEGWGRGCFSYKEKKNQTIFIFNSSEILSCCFAEVDALAAMASAKCRSAPGVLCSAHVPLSLHVREIPVDSHLGMLPCSTSARPRRRILGFECRVSQKHVSSPSWVSFLSIFLGTLSAEGKFG